MFIPTSFPEIEFKMLIFSGGESHIKLNNFIDYDEVSKVVITTRIKNGDDVMQLLIAADALKRKGIKNLDLIMPYIPYARQDRQCSDGESFTLKVFTGIINSVGFDKVYVFDAHSGISTTLIENVVEIDNHQYVSAALDMALFSLETEFNLISIDAGASKKINSLAEYIYNSGRKNFKVIQCNKKRNVSNGNIEGFEVFSGDLQGLPCFITDDICDGGASFIHAAKALKEKNAGDLYLFVSHGIFSKGFDELKEYYTRIFTTNSFSDVKNGILTKLRLDL
jgi:ribose-phosphate pyrophosphokinase